MEDTYLNISELLDIAKYLEDEGAFEAEEQVLKDALEGSEDPMVRWTLLFNLAGFYYSNQMYSEMDRISDQMIEEFPDNYAGYHLRITSEIDRDEFDKAKEYMDSISEDFMPHPQFLTDYLKANMALGDTEYLEPILAILSSEYGDPDATVAAMVMLFLRGQHAESGVLAKTILEEDAENRSYRSYLAYIFQINNLYILSDKHPEGKVKEWMREALEWVKDYQTGMELDNEEVNKMIQDMEQFV